VRGAAAHAVVRIDGFAHAERIHGLVGGLVLQRVDDKVGHPVLDNVRADLLFRKEYGE